jgi:5'-deoxynucleotidase YfbR-like HD superfamily hydrolase
MHDAAEAFVGDMSKPLKMMLPEYSVIEKRVEAAIFSRFNVSTPLPKEIKQADIQMLVTEQHQLMKNRDDWEYCRESIPLDFEIKSWSPGQSKSRFIKRFHQLTQPLR